MKGFRNLGYNFPPRICQLYQKFMYQNNSVQARGTLSLLVRYLLHCLVEYFVEKRRRRQDTLQNLLFSSSASFLQHFIKVEDISFSCILLYPISQEWPVMEQLHLPVNEKALSPRPPLPACSHVEEVGAESCFLPLSFAFFVSVPPPLV